MLSFSRDPKGYVQDLLRSQSRDLKVKRGLREHWHQDKHMGKERWTCNSGR